MKSFQLTILSEKDADKVMSVLNGLAIAGLIEITGNTAEAVAPNVEQTGEIIDESELAPYYSEQEIKEILHL